MSDWITETVRALGYIGIALLAFLENVFPPIPSEVIMPLAGFIASDGDINLLGAIAAGAFGSFIGAAGWYFIGRKVGEERLRRWVDQHGHWLTLSCEDLDKAQHFLQHHGGAVVFFGRLIPGIRTWISVPAGVAGMPLGRFLLYTGLGTGIWTAVLTFAGYALRSQFEQVDKYLGPISMAVFVLIAVWYFYRLATHFLRRRLQH